ncbi:MAG: DNA-directed RNA polymerase subunit E'' [Nanoarchaeota archaeon]|nr:DNA-directed RNA polymerase subunit E'' [Nanoarchaeota archaeon]MBU4124196.1 DNA-directed RNA polymerase subunit E'' [Nanoarchaeota archaeon]
MADKACRLCRRIVKGNICPACKTTELSKNWKGVLVVLDAESEIAKKAGITAPGRYAITVK